MSWLSKRLWNRPQKAEGTPGGLNTPGNVADTAYGISTAERNKQGNQIGWGNESVGQSKQLTRAGFDTAESGKNYLDAAGQSLEHASQLSSQVDPMLSRYTTQDASGTTPFRRALFNTKAHETAGAYDNAMARTREAAAASGMGGPGQGAAFGAQTALRNERAGAIGDIGNQVELQAPDVEMAAMDLQNRTQLGHAGLYNQLANTQLGQTSQNTGIGEAQMNAGAGYNANANTQLNAANIYNPTEYFRQGNLAEQMARDRKSKLYSTLLGLAAPAIGRIGAPKPA